MTGSNAIKSRLQLVTFKLNSLLDITNGINENLSIENLLKRYEKILKEDLNIGKIAVFKYHQKWECILNKGFKDSITTQINIERDLIKFTEITFVTSSPIITTDTVDIVIPVMHNMVPIAYVIIGDIDEDAEGMSPTIKHLHFIQTLSNIIVVAIENIRLFNESLEQARFKKELELASKMQNMLVPSKESLPCNNQIAITAFYHPHFEVGGDYYDFIDLRNEEYGFCIADVSGKGISAALLMSNFQANLRALFSPEISLDNLVYKLNDRVMFSAKGEKFITLFIAKYNAKSRCLQYINAGHNQPILYDVNDKQMQVLDKGCVGIGMLDKIPTIKMGELYIKSRTKLLCYTDGLVELIDETEVESGLKLVEHELTNNNYIGDNIASIIEHEEILKGNKRIFDDITMLGVEFY